MNRYYAQKPIDYYQNSRTDLEGLILGRDLCVLEIGCSSGSLGAALLSSGKAALVDGIEPHEDAARSAAGRLTSVIVGTVEESVDRLSKGYYDCIIMGDVLEHLVDPWDVLARLVATLKPGGSAVISLPNVQSVDVILPLIRGTWKYSQDGILDRTHLRFFTRRGSRELLKSSGLRLLSETPRFRGRRFEWTARLSMGLLTQYLAQGWISVAVRD